MTSFIIILNKCPIYEVKDCVRQFNGTFVEIRENPTSDNQGIFLANSFDNGGERVHLIPSQKIIVKLKNGQNNNIIGKPAKVSLAAKIPENRDSSFNYKNYLYSEKIFFCSDYCKIESIDANTKRSYFLRHFSLSLKKKFLGKLKTLEANSFSDSIASDLTNGLLFGNSSNIDKTVVDEFRHNGTAHILAVSGLHIGIIYLIYKKLQNITSSNWVTIIFVPLLIFYGFLSNWSPSVIRAIFVVLMKLYSDLRNLYFDALTALSTIFLIAIICNPYRILNVGFQMSFLAATLLTTLIPFIRKNNPYLPVNAIIAFFLPIILFPYMEHVFENSSFNGIIANPPVIFISGILVPLGLFIFMFFTITNIVPRLSSLIYISLCRILVKINSLIAELLPYSFEISLATASIVFFYGFLFYLTSETYFILKKRKMHQVYIFPFLITLVCSFLLVSN